MEFAAVIYPLKMVIENNAMFPIMAILTGDQLLWSDRISTTWFHLNTPSIMK